MQGKVLKAEAEPAVYVGIDVSKASLDVYLQPIGQWLCFENSKTGLQGLLKALRGLDVALIVVEATGKLHRLAHSMLSDAGFPVAVVNPYRSRKFAEVLGQLAKTDKIDARILALYGEKITPKTTPVADQPLVELQELVMMRQALKADQTASSNRLLAAGCAFVKRLAKRQLKQVRCSILLLDQRIKALIAADSGLYRRFEILTSIKGIGAVTAATLVACLTELGLLSSGSIALLTGLAPVNCDSGTMRGQRHIKGGRGHVRTSLYMAALTASRRNPDLTAFYQRLLSNGKATKLALTAVMRKLVILANTLVRENRLWLPQKP